MVGVPRSRGCKTCVRRKIKCDETRPECLNCVRKGLVCPGYTRVLKFYFSTPQSADTWQNQSRQHRQTKETGMKDPKSLSIDECLAPNLNYEAINLQTRESFSSWLMHYFPNTYSSFSARVEINWMDFLRDKWSSCPHALLWALRALNTYQAGILHHNDDLIFTARHMYGQGIQHLSKLLRTQSALADETLAAAILLGGYEVLDGSAEGSWVFHSHGIRHLMCARGPQAHKGGFGRTMLLSFRPFLLAEAWVHAERCFLGDAEWTAMVNDIAMAEDQRGQASLLGQTWDYAFNEIAKCPGYYSAARAIILAGSSSPGTRDRLMGDVEDAKGRLRMFQIGLVNNAMDTATSISFVGPIPPAHATKLACLAYDGITSAIAVLDQLAVILQSEVVNEPTQTQIDMLMGLNNTWRFFMQKPVFHSPALTAQDRCSEDGLDRFSLAMGMPMV